MVSWVLPAIVLLTSAMASLLAVTLYGIDRTVGLAVLYAVWALCAYMIIVGIQKQKRSPIYTRTRIRTLLSWFLVALPVSTSAVYASEIRSDIGAVILQTAALIYMTLPFFVFHFAAARVEIGKLVLYSCHVILVVGLASILTDFVGPTNYEAAGNRYFGAVGDQVAWALVLPFVVYFSSNRIPLTVIAGVGLALTGSRAPALVAIAALILLMAFASGRRLQYVAILFVLAVIFVFQADVFDTLLGRITETDLKSSDRTITARLGLRIFTESPLFGSGYNSLSHFYPATIRRSALGVLPTQTSTFVQMLSDWGVLVFLPYFGFVIACTTAGISAMRQSRFLRDASVINGVVAWTLAMLWVNQAALWFVVGSFIGPLVFGMAGLVSGYCARLSQVRNINLPHLARPLKAAAGRLTPLAEAPTGSPYQLLNRR